MISILLVYSTTSSLVWKIMISALFLLLICFTILYPNDKHQNRYKISYSKTKHNPKFLDAGIQDVSTSISIVHDLIEISPDGEESDKHI